MTRKDIIFSVKSEETEKLGFEMASRIGGGEIICLQGELGAGKTTFTQGFLKALGARGPYTSPTFLIMKQYEIEKKETKIKNVYHIDAYRIGAEDLLGLGWEEIVQNKENVIIIEWPEKVKEILPEKFWQIQFEWLGENKRKIAFNIY